MTTHQTGQISRQDCADGVLTPKAYLQRAVALCERHNPVASKVWTVSRNRCITALMYQLTCNHCQAPYESQNKQSRWCSEGCHKLSRRKPAASKKCLKCGAEFTTAKTRQKYCSIECWNVAYSADLKGDGFSHYPGTPTGTVGAVGELIVAADLLTKGFEVFRALSPSSSCDLAILNGNKLLRVEVRTGYVRPKHKLRTSSKRHRADILAINCGPAGIRYEPPLTTNPQ